MPNLPEFNGKRLFILRHAQAISDHSGQDRDRALSPKGKEDALALGQAMIKQNTIPDVILCSPATRTRQTLEGLKHSFNIKNCHFPDILYNGATGDYLDQIQKINDRYQNILMIAHNPSIYELVIFLAKRGQETQLQRLSEGYAPASLSIINCTCEKWNDLQPAENELVQLINPIDYNAPARPTRWM